MNLMAKFLLACQLICIWKNAQHLDTLAAMGFSKKDLQRIDSSKRNATVALATSVFMSVASFLERMVFNQVFIDEYLGLHSFFNSTLNVLSMLQVGLPASIAYALYAPLADGDSDQVWAIMRLFKKAYRIIGSAILLLGLCFLPFMDRFLITEIPMDKVRVYFVVNLLATVFNYYLMYTSVLITADQQEYKVTLITNLSWTFMYLLQILVSLASGNYFFYTLVYLGASLARALAMNLVARKDYPCLWSRRDVKLAKSNREKIVNNVKGLMSAKFSSAIVTSTDSILTSSMLGASILGRYSNYQMISDGLRQVASLLPRTVLPSIGNLGASEGKERLKRSFEVLSQGSYLVYGPLSIVLLAIVNSIVNLFFAGRTLPMVSVVIVVLNFYFANCRELLLTYKAAMGLYYEDRWRPIAEAVVNLVLSYLMGLVWGFNGIIGATVITCVGVNIVTEMWLICRKGFGCSPLREYMFLVRRFVFTFAVAALVMLATSLIPLQTGILRLGVELLLAVVIVAVSFLLAYFRNPDAKVVASAAKVALFRKRVKESD